MRMVTLRAASLGLDAARDLCGSGRNSKLFGGGHFQGSGQPLVEAFTKRRPGSPQAIRPATPAAAR